MRYLVQGNKCMLWDSGAGTFTTDPALPLLLTDKKLSDLTGKEYLKPWIQGTGHGSRHAINYFCVLFYRARGCRLNKIWPLCSPGRTKTGQGTGAAGCHRTACYTRTKTKKGNRWSFHNPTKKLPQIWR